MRRLLVTGGAGFIGSNFVRYLLKNNPDDYIINLDALTYAGRMENLEDLPDPERHLFICGNTCDRELVVSILRNEEIDTIIHFAAETHVDRSILDPETFFLSNIHCTFQMLEAARQVWGRDESKRFHYISTDEVFGSLAPEEKASTEQSRPHPSSPYSASKAAGDNLVCAYNITYGLQTTISHCTNNYGPYQLPEKLIPKIILQALRGQSITIHGDGKQIRDWLHVEDHCRAIDVIIKHGVIGEDYNIGGACQLPNANMVYSICFALHSVLGTDFRQQITYVEDRIGNDRRYDLDCSKLRDALGWYPQIPIHIGLATTVKWYLDHQDWMQKVSAAVLP